MMIACPFCGVRRRDLLGLSLHIEDDHADDGRQLVLAIAPSPAPVPSYEQTPRFPGVDIDAVHWQRRAIGADA